MERKKEREYGSNKNSSREHSKNYHSKQDSSREHSKNDTIKLVMPVTQNDMTMEHVKKDLKGFKLIKPEDYKTIEPGWLIKYFNHEDKYRVGGILLENLYPYSLKLKSKNGEFIWSLNLEKSNKIFYKIDEQENDLEEYKNAISIYRDIKNKKYKLVDMDEYIRMVKIIKDVRNK